MKSISLNDPNFWVLRLIFIACIMLFVYLCRYINIYLQHMEDHKGFLGDFAVNEASVRSKLKMNAKNGKSLSLQSKYSLVILAIAIVPLLGVTIFSCSTSGV